MASVEVDVDCTDFDYEELIAAIRYKLKYERKDEVKKEVLKQIREELFNQTEQPIEIKSDMFSEQKIELFTKNIDRFTVEQLEGFIHQHGGQIFNYMVQIGVNK